MSTTSLEPPNIIALLGGTFDPIHFGHILPAQEAAQWLGAKQLVLIPAHIPPHKTRTHATAKQRAKMVSLICQNSEILTLDIRELNRQSPSFTIDTLREIKTEQPNAILYFIIGMDSLLSFTQWHGWQDILTLCNLVVNIRPGYPHHRLESTLEPALTSRLIYSIEHLQHNKTGQIILHESTAVDISSTEIRAKIKARANYSEFLPKPVYDYIEQYKLYR